MIATEFLPTIPRNRRLYDRSGLKHKDLAERSTIRTRVTQAMDKLQRRMLDEPSRKDLRAAYNLGGSLRALFWNGVISDYPISEYLNLVQSLLGN